MSFKAPRFFDFQNGLVFRGVDFKMLKIRLRKPSDTPLILPLDAPRSVPSEDGIIEAIQCEDVRTRFFKSNKKNPLSERGKGCENVGTAIFTPRGVLPGVDCKFSHESVQKSFKHTPDRSAERSTICPLKMGFF